MRIVKALTRTRAKVSAKDMTLLPLSKSSWLVAYERRAMRPSKRYLEERRELMERLDGLSPSDEEVAIPETLLFVRDACWRLVRGQPPHQYWESFMCGVLAINLVVSLVVIDLGPFQMYVMPFVLVAFAGLEMLLKLLAYGVKGCLSSPADAIDLTLATLMLVLVPLSYFSDWSLTSRSLGHGDVDVFLGRFCGIILFYRVPRLLMHWRFLRDFLRPTRALLDALVLAAPSMLNVFMLLSIVLYIYAILGYFWFGELGDTEVGGELTLATANGTAVSVNASAFWRSREVSVGINDLANFRTVPHALLTLVRVLTGDQWSVLFADCMLEANGTQSTMQTVFAVIFYVSFIFISQLCLNLLVAVLLTQGIETYFDSGLLKSSSLPFLLIKCKKRLMRPVLQLRQTRELGSRQRVLMHSERTTQCRLVEYWLSRLDGMEAYKNVKDGKGIPRDHWLVELPRTYHWLERIPPSYFLWTAGGREAEWSPALSKPNKEMFEGMDPMKAKFEREQLMKEPRVVISGKAAIDVASEYERIQLRLREAHYDRVAEVYWHFKVRTKLRQLEAREIEQLFLAAVWDAALQAEIPAMLDLDGEEQAGRRMEKAQIATRQLALARVQSLLLFRPALARCSRVKWTLTGDSPLHASAFMGDVGLTLLLIKNGASPRRTNSDGNLTIGPEVRATAMLLAPGATPEMIRAVCSRLMVDGLADARGRIKPDAYADSLNLMTTKLRDEVATAQAAARQRFGKAAWKKGFGKGGLKKGQLTSMLGGTGNIKSMKGLRQLTKTKANLTMRDIIAPMEMKHLASLRACVMHRNTCVHYAILGFQPACIRGLDREERPAISLAKHLRLQANVLELLLWPQAYTEAHDPNVKLLAGDPAKPNVRGETPLDLAAKQGSDELLQKILGWDNDQQELQGEQADIDAQSLSNLHNSSSGDTPLLACLRECGRRLRWVGDQTASKYNEYHLLELLAASGALLRHPFADPFVRGHSALSPTYGLPMPGGGASPLLFLLVAADSTEAALKVTRLPGDRRDMLVEALELITKQLTVLVDGVEEGPSRDSCRRSSSACTIQRHTASSARAVRRAASTLCCAHGGRTSSLTRRSGRRSSRHGRPHHDTPST